MILTINLIDITPNIPQRLAVCNLNINTDEPEAVTESFQKIIPLIHNEKNFRGSAADLLSESTGFILKWHPSARLISVNDNPSLADENNVLNVYMHQKGTTYVESSQQMAN